MNVGLRRGLSTLAGVALVLSFAAFSGSSEAGATSGAAKGGDYIIGDDDALSGPLALYGDSTSSYLRAAVDYVNSTGGINGHQVRIISGDFEAAGANATSIAQQLISEDHVNVLAGLTFSAYCGQVAPLAARNHIPEVCYSMPSTTVQPVEPYAFAGYSTGQQGGVPVVQFMKKNLKLPAGSTYALYTGDSAGPESFANTVAKDANAAGYKQVSNQLIPLTAVNGDTEIASLVAAKPKVVIAFPNELQVAPLVKSLRAAGNDAPVILAWSSISYADLVSIADPNVYQLESTQFITNLSTKASGAAMAVKGLKEEGLSTLDSANPVLNSAFPWSVAILQGLKRCGWPCSGPKLDAQLNKTNLDLPGIVGSFVWTAKDHDPYTTVYMYHYDPSIKQPALVTTLPVGPVNG
jgi:branched-chain amino acid transport system substrate-binding protein